MNNFVLASVVMCNSVALIFDLLSGDVGCFGDTARTAASGYDLNAEMIDSNFSFLLHDFSENVPEHFVR